MALPMNWMLMDFHLVASCFNYYREYGMAIEMEFVDPIRNEKERRERRRIRKVVR